jgi:hypothetical protein
MPRGPSINGCATPLPEHLLLSCDALVVIPAELDALLSGPCHMAANLIGICAGCFDLGLFAQVAKRETVAAGIPLEVRLSTSSITRFCCASLSSGKIGRLSTSEHSRSVTGSDPGP